MSAGTSVLASAESAIAGAASVSTPWGALATLGTKLLDFIPDPAQKAAAAQAVAEGQLQLALAQMQQQNLDAQTASNNIQHDGLSGPRKVFSYAYIALMVWNYAIVPMLHKPAASLPMEFTIAFTTLLLGTSAMSIGKSVALAPGDSSVNVLGVKLGNKS